MKVQNLQKQKFLLSAVGLAAVVVITETKTNTNELGFLSFGVPNVPNYDKPMHKGNKNST
jgi:hypothetical protein